MKARWYCGHFVGPLRWHGTETYEPDECCTEFVTEIDPQEWAEGICTAICPSCGAELFQEDDEPILIKETADG